METYHCHDLSMTSQQSLSPLVLSSSSPQPQSPHTQSGNGGKNNNGGSPNSNSSNGGSSSGSGKQRMVIDWTENEAEVLMNEYEVHRCLWDPSHPNYHSNNERTHAYVKILDKLGDKFNITDIKKKINSIRTQFNQERNRLMKMTESGIGRVEDTRFKYYDRLSFLAESVDIRRNQRSITPKSSEETQSASASSLHPTSSLVSSVSSASLSDPSGHLDLLKNHQTAALTLANLGNASSYNSMSPQHRQLSASEISSMIPPLLSSELVSKLASAESQVPNGVPLSISTSATLDEDLRNTRSVYSSGSLSLQALVNGVIDASSAGDIVSSDSTGVQSSRVPTIVYQGSSANHIPISPVTAFPQQQQQQREHTPSQNNSSLSLPISAGSTHSPSPKVKQEGSNSSNSSSIAFHQSELSSPTKTSKPTCAILPEANKSRSVVAPQINSQSGSINGANVNSLRSMVPPRKRQKFANMHDMVNPSHNSTLHIPKNSTVNLQVNEARNKAEETRQCGADESFGAYIAAEIKSIRNQSIKNKLKLQIISLIIQSSNDEILGFSTAYD